MTSSRPSAISNGGQGGSETRHYVTLFASSSVEAPAEASAGSGNDAPPPIVAPYGISLACGDAIVGIDEECDDGPGDGLDACTADCKTRDQPAVTLTPAQGFDRYLGAGRHPISGLTTGFAATYLEVGQGEPTVAASLFNIWGQPTHHVTVSADAAPIDDANPVIAALPDGSFAFAWGDFDGDGSDLGVALRRVSADGAVGPLLVANAGTEFSQLNPDMIWTGTQLVVVWEDYADANNGPDLRYRTFDSDLNPTSDDVTLAGSVLPEVAVALTPFNNHWAAAYREGTADGKENVVVRVGDSSFRVGPIQGGPLDDRPALVGLDATHLLVVFSAGTDPGSTGVYNVPRLRYAVVDVAGAATQPSQTLDPQFDAYAGDASVSQMSPSVASAPDGAPAASISWRSEARPGDAVGDQIWLKFVTWNSATATLTVTEQEMPVPRPWPENLGNQRRPALAAVGLPPSGALAVAWDDYSHSQGPDAGSPDVVVRYAPSHPRALSQLAAGTGDHDCARIVDGTVRCWGINDRGQLGSGTSEETSLLPIMVPGLTNVTAVSTGSFHTCALLADHTVRCWGMGENGQLGDGGTTDSTRPVVVSGLTDAIAISAGGHHTCALRTGGVVSCWGLNSYYETGSTAASDLPRTKLPAVVPGLSGVTAVYTGGFHTCVLVSGGVKCWGDNSIGQLGIGSLTPLKTLTPTSVNGLTSGVSQLSVGEQTNCVIVSGTVRCWGDNTYGQVGNGSSSPTPVTTPVAVAGLANVADVGAGFALSCARLTSKQVRCWGRNLEGELGTGTGVDSPTPVTVTGISNADALIVGEHNGCVLLPSGAARCWGYGGFGTLGNGTTVDALSPVSLLFP